MSADPSEGRERARQDDELGYLEWFKKEHPHLTLGGYRCMEYQPVWLAGRRSLEQERDELREACQWMSKALGLDAQLHEALKDLIPSPGSLSPEKHALWQKVVSVIYEAAELSDTRDTVPALRDRKF